MPITVDFATSLGGRPCIKMTTDHNSSYILLVSKRAPMAGAMIKQLETDFGCFALPGIPLDIRESFNEKKLIFHEELGVLGVYVQEQRFDELFTLGLR
jgi:hypothetical protein